MNPQYRMKCFICHNCGLKFLMSLYMTCYTCKNCKSLLETQAGSAENESSLSVFVPRWVVRYAQIGSESGVPPASQLLIDSLDFTSPQELVNSSCSICRDEFLDNQVVRLMPCSHAFHDRCLTSWLRIHNTCPLCRRSITNA